MKIGRIVTTVVLALMLTACSLPGAPDPGRPDSSRGSDPGCGTCERQLAPVTAQTKKLAGVIGIRETSFTPGSPTNGNTVSVSVNVSVDAPADLPDRIASLVWDSEVRPLDYIVVNLVTGGSEQDFSSYEVRPEGADYASYVEQWGERPVG